MCANCAQKAKLTDFRKYLLKYFQQHMSQFIDINHAQLYGQQESICRTSELSENALSILVWSEVR